MPFCILQDVFRTCTSLVRYVARCILYYLFLLCAFLRGYLGLYIAWSCISHLAGPPRCCHHPLRGPILSICVMRTDNQCSSRTLVISMPSSGHTVPAFVVVYFSFLRTSFCTSLNLFIFSMYIYVHLHSYIFLYIFVDGSEKHLFVFLYSM